MRDLITKNDTKKNEKKNFRQENKNLNFEQKKIKTTPNILKTSALIFKRPNTSLKLKQSKEFYKDILSRVELLNFTINFASVNSNFPQLGSCFLIIFIFLNKYFLSLWCY